MEDCSMWNDERSKKMVAVINCVLNHSARAPGAAVYPGINHDVIDILKKYGVGVIQMPCPEMVCIDLPRTRPDGASIHDVLDMPEGRSCCERLSASVVDSIEEYRRHGFTVAAVLGGDVGSPGCAVHVSSTENGRQMLGEGSGVFIQTLQEELRRRDIEIPFRGIRDSARETLQEDLEWLEGILGEL